MDEQLMVGLVDDKGNLVRVSELSSQIEGTAFDGLVVWDDAETARESIECVGQLPAGYRLVLMTVRVSTKL